MFLRWRVFEHTRPLLTDKVSKCARAHQPKIFGVRHLWEIDSVKLSSMLFDCYINCGSKDCFLHDEVEKEQKTNLPKISPRMGIGEAGQPMIGSLHQSSDLHIPAPPIQLVRNPANQLIRNPLRLTLNPTRNHFPIQNPNGPFFVRPNPEPLVPFQVEADTQGTSL